MNRTADASRSPHLSFVQPHAQPALEVGAQKIVLCELAQPDEPGLRSYSPFCVKAIAALALTGLAYESRRGAMPGAFKKLNPTGQVPVLLVDEDVVSDSTNIVARLDHMSGGVLSRDLDAAQRAEARLWEDYADTALNGFLVAARWADNENWTRTRKAYFGSAPAPVRLLVAPRLRAGIVKNLVARDVWRAGPAACWSRFAATLDQLDATAPGTHYWVSETLSVADVGIYAQLSSLRTRLTPRQALALQQRTRLSAYLDRVADAIDAGQAERSTRPRAVNS